MGIKTKLGPQKWNLRPQKRAEALAEVDAVRPIAEAPRKTILTCNFHEELVFAETPRKQNQLTNHPRKPLYTKLYKYSRGNFYSRIGEFVHNLNIFLNILEF
jgi:hypothetical protein